jgi:hypothetical protein
MNQKKNHKDGMTLLGDGGRSNGPSETLKTSLQALREHSKELVFETRSQAVRSLMRARRLDRYTAHEHVMGLARMGLIRYEKLNMEHLQPRLEFAPAEPQGASTCIVGATPA